MFILVFLNTGLLYAQKSKRAKGKGKKAKIETITDFEMDPATQLKVDKLYVEACTHMIRGDVRSAKDDFEEVLLFDPGNHAAMYNIAKLAYEQREYDRALNFGKAALDRDPNNYWYYNILEQTYESQGNYLQAIEVQQELIRRFPQKLRDQLHLATLHERAGKYDLALEHLNKIEAKFGPKEQVSRRKYQLYRHQEELGKALAATDMLIGINPRNRRYYQWQYEIYKELGREEEGVASLKRLLEKEPNNGFALLSLADYYKSQNDVAVSDEYLFRAFSNPEIEVEGKVDIMQQLLDLADKEPEVVLRIKRLSKIFVENHPDIAETYRIQAEVFLLDQKADSASKYFRRSLALEPDQLTLWERMLAGAFRLGDYRQLQKDSEESLEFFPNQPSFLFYYGVANSRMGDYRSATYALQKIRKIGTDKKLAIQAKAELAYIDQRKGNPAKAEQSLAESLQEATDNPFILQIYAQSLVERRQKLDLAQKMINKAIEARPFMTDYQATYGWVLYLLNRTKEAEEWLKKAATNSKTPLVLEHYGDVLYRLGQKEAAQIQWQKAIDAGAKDLHIQQKMQN